MFFRQRKPERQQRKALKITFDPSIHILVEMPLQDFWDFSVEYTVFETKDHYWAFDDAGQIIFCAKKANSS